MTIWLFNIPFELKEFTHFMLIKKVDLISKYFIYEAHYAL